MTVSRCILPSGDQERDAPAEWLVVVDCLGGSSSCPIHDQRFAPGGEAPTFS